MRGSTLGTPSGDTTRPARGIHRRWSGALLAMLLALTVLSGQHVSAPPTWSGYDGPTAIMTPADWLAAQRTPRASAAADAAAWAAADAVVGGSGYARALAQAAAMSVAPVMAWHRAEERGPIGIGGRITDLAFDPVSRRLYVAAASGGLWVSEDEGRTVVPAWPADAVQAIGAVAVLGDGTVLAGTGEANAGGGSTTFGGDGMYRSSDGGATWEHVGLGSSWAVARILPHPEDPTRAWAAAAGNLFLPGGDRGIYETTDSGRTWQQILAPATPTTGGSDLTVAPDDPDHLLASTWDRQRSPSLRRYGGEGSGLHRSRDGGATWEPVGGGLPGFTADAGRQAVAFSPADADRVYSVVTRGDGRADGLYRSDDGGGTWARIQSGGLYAASQFIFGWWFSKVFPAPEDPDRVLVPGLILLESTDGGETVTADSSVHPDHHAMVWDPDDPATAWLGTDGGLYTSRRGGALFSFSLADVQPFTQQYTVAVQPGEAAGERLASGTQDNGCLLTGGPADGWSAARGCGDGLTLLAHPSDPDHLIYCGQYGDCRLTTDYGRTARPLGERPGARRNWGAPLERVPGVGDELLFGAEVVSRSTDGGTSWRVISPDLTRGSAPDPDYPYGTITQLHAVSTADLLAGTDDGLLWRTRDGGDTWTMLLDQPRWITGIATGEDPDLVIAATSGYFAGETAPSLLRSDDGGATWTDIAGTLPDASINEVRATADGWLLVASDVGFFVSTDALRPGQAQPATWSRVPGLPQAPVLDVTVHETTRTATVATFGRGAWRVPLVQLDRIAGADRYATGVALAARQFGPGDAPDRVLLASGEDFPDALAAAAVAAADPSTVLLLTAGGTLPQVVAAQLADWRPPSLIAVGGEAAVSAAVLEQAVSLTGAQQVGRWAGGDRHATAAAVARAAVAPSDVAVLARSDQPFDALTGAGLAALLDAPIVLVQPDELPAASAELLAERRPARIIALGGPAAIGEAVLEAAAAAAGGGTSERVSGPSRTATAAAVARAVLEEGAAPGEAVWIASGSGFADALGAAATGEVVLLSSASGLDEHGLEGLALAAPRSVYLAGGPAAVSDEVLDQLLRTP